MNHDNYKSKYRIPSNRLQGFDYGSNAAYFVTICTHEKFNYLGQIHETQSIASLQKVNLPQSLVDLSEIGKVAYRCWLDIPKYAPFVILDEFIIMPNHIHGILMFNKADPVETQHLASHTNETQNTFGPQSQNLASVIRGYKSGVKAYATLNDLDFQWQARYHDRIIRNDQELQNIRNYIFNNPLNWQMDEENVRCKS